MRERRDTPLSGQGLSKEKREALEGIINPLMQGEESLLPARMDKTFRKEIKHQLKFLKKRNIRREFYFAGVSSPGNFTKWNDGGREWREVEMDASVLEKVITNAKTTYRRFL